MLVDKRFEVETETSIDLVSLVNSHEKPFVIIDKSYRILAVNKAYLQAYRTTSEDAVGMMCYQMSHGRDRPCNEEGEECPHEYIFNTRQTKVCAHIHCDAEHHMHHVKVSAYPLKGSNNELFLGECIEEMSVDINQRAFHDRMVGESSAFTDCVIS